jgi:hypothetical protein
LTRIRGCINCRTKKAENSLVLETPQSILKGGDSGPAVVPGKPNESLLIEAVLHTGDISHLSKPEEFDTVDQILKSASAKDVFFVPGEHDVLNDDGKSYQERYGKNAKGDDNSSERFCFAVAIRMSGIGGTRGES